GAVPALDLPDLLVELRLFSRRYSPQHGLPIRPHSSLLHPVSNSRVLVNGGRGRPVAHPVSIALSGELPWQTSGRSGASSPSSERPPCCWRCRLARGRTRLGASGRRRSIPPRPPSTPRRISGTFPRSTPSVGSRARGPSTTGRACGGSRSPT